MLAVMCASRNFFYKNVILINPVKMDFVVMQQRNLNRFKYLQRSINSKDGNKMIKNDT